MIDDLVAFLCACSDEDEQAATDNGRLHGDVWTAVERGRPTDVTWDVVGAGRGEVAQAMAWEARHIARHDPVRVLRDVEATREIIRLYEQARADYRTLADQRARSVDLDKPSPTPEEYRAMDMGDAYERALVLLALRYADHPDYRDEWRP